MKVSITHSEVKRQNTLYYVHCQVDFNEEEKAIIRERSLYDQTLSFDGNVNYPPGAETSIQPWFLQTAARILFLVGLAATFFNANLAAVCWIAAAGCFFYRKNMERDQTRGLEHDISIRKIMQGPFSVCGFNNPVATQVHEDEIRKQLEVLKGFLTASSSLPMPKTFEL